MAKVYIVYQVWGESYYDHLAEKDTREKTVEGVFDCEDKAIDYICDRMRKDCKLINKLFRGDNTVRTFNPDPGDIKAFSGCRCWDRTRRDADDCDITVSYEYKPYDVM